MKFAQLKFFENRMSKRRIAADLLCHSGASRFFSWTQSRRLTVVGFHRVWSPELGDAALSFENDLFDISAPEFRKQMAWLAKNTDVLSEKDLLQISRGQAKPPKRPVMLTFDDGYIDNFTIAQPILKEFKLPATFFICTDMLEKRQVGWWDEIAYMFKTARKGLPCREEISQCQNYVKTQKNLDVEFYLDNVALRLGVQRPAKALQDSQLMTWLQVRQTLADGFAIGSHSCSHRVFATLSEEKQKAELRESKIFLEEVCAKKMVSFAFPVGSYEHLSENSTKLAKEAGYELLFTYETGLNPMQPDPQFIRRVGAQPTSNMFVAAFMLPELFGAHHA
jgi:peptidoglycan/xylan/chitin deacetylase (PgdA/CDA1 family)